MPKKKTKTKGSKKKSSSSAATVKRPPTWGITVEFINRFKTDHPKYWNETIMKVMDDLIAPATSKRRSSYCALFKTDTTLVGTATIFLTHAYSMQLSDCLEVALQHNVAHPPPEGEVNYYWFDPFSTNQYTAWAGGKKKEEKHRY